MRRNVASAVVRHKPASVKVNNGIQQRGVLQRRILQGRTFALNNQIYATQGSLNSFMMSKHGEEQTISKDININSESNNFQRTVNEFWDKVNTNYNEESKQFEIQLDGKNMKTPFGNALAFPREKKHLAHLVAYEWQSLPALQSKIHSMPITSLAARSVDLHETNKTDKPEPEKVAQVGSLEDIHKNVSKYLDTDTCLVFATSDEYEGQLRRKQEQLYLPLIKEFEDYFSAYAKSRGMGDNKVKLTYLDCEKDGLRGNRQTSSTREVILRWMEELSTFQLVAFEKAVLNTKSFMCGFSLLRSNCSDPLLMKHFFQLNKTQGDYFYKSVEEIAELANLEVIFQTNEWGEVEDSHDVDKVDWLRNLSSAAIVAF